MKQRRRKRSGAPVIVKIIGSICVAIVWGVTLWHTPVYLKIGASLGDQIARYWLIH